MAMRSLGAAPSALSAFTRSSTLDVAGTPTALRFSSSAWPNVFFTTAVVPAENGAGCEAVLFVEMVTLRPPCATTAGLSRTWPPSTTVPVRSLTATRARTSASTSSASSFASTPTAPPSASLGIVTSMAAASSAFAQRLVDRLADAQRVREVGLLEREQQRPGAEHRHHRALDRATLGHAARV